MRQFFLIAETINTILFSPKGTENKNKIEWEINYYKCVEKTTTYKFVSDLQWTVEKGNNTQIMRRVHINLEVATRNVKDRRIFWKWHHVL